MLDNFPFEENPNVAVLTCFCVLHEGKPILYVSHDLEDGMWQFLCGETHTENVGMTVSFSICSTAFQSKARFLYSGGALSGSKISVCITSLFRV